MLYETAYSCTNETVSVCPNTAIEKPVIYYFLEVLNSIELQAQINSKLERQKFI